MRNAMLFGLTAALLSSSCQAFGATRGFTVVMAMLAAVLAWVAHRGQARAGGSTGATGTGTASSGTADTTTTTTSSGTADTTTTATGTGSSGGSTGSAGADEALETSACLSAPYDGSDTETAMAVCLCACETGKERDGSDWAPALLLPVVAQRRRSRRQSLERIAADGRLPIDVIARLRQRIDAGN